MTATFTHRFIPNSSPGVREEMLAEIGISSVDEIYEAIPAELRFAGEFNLPRDPLSEAEVARVVTSMLEKDKTKADYLCFVGAGCYDHYAPALLAEVMGRSEFLTAYAGIEVTDHGRFMAMFEYQAMMGDLLEMDVVGSAVYDGATASGDALQMASRITGRREFVLPQNIDPERLKVMLNYVGFSFDVVYVKGDPVTGTVALDDLREKVSEKTAAVYFENPGYLGVVETRPKEISRIAHEKGALLIASVNPASLGVLAPPGQYDADIACGDGQPLGLPMSCGGARLGILACKNEHHFVNSLPMLMVGILRTAVPGERAYTWHALFDRIFYGTREEARSISGTSSFLMALGAGVYLALLGPKGMRDLGIANIQKAGYAMRHLNSLPGVRAPVFSGPHFNEFLVDFNGSGKTVAEINQALLVRGILGGKDVSTEFPQQGQVALYCVTENRTQSDIDRLVHTLEDVLR
ncbi:MAG: aminomethyl-transferring glycine dehydrogenase subunit GcvPA [Actinomycetota bacterium]|nr:aminomethyl-transferring glycine dehydrogenase subunit GcvPA [Actinomycetota bacterium]